MDSRGGFSVSAFAAGLRQRARPDVPEDVQEALDHLNDPNYDFSSSRSDSSSTIDTVDIREWKRPAAGKAIETDAASSNFDTASQTGSSISPSVFRVRAVEGVEYEEESPYAEVRAAVANTDDPRIPVNTFRAWFLGLLFTVIISGINQMFSLRFPNITITSLIVQLLALPCGKLMARFLPRTRFRTWGYIWSLNPGPFNIKEHTLITVMANVIAANGNVYATAIVGTQRTFFNQSPSFGYQILLCLSTQLIGFSFAGLVRQFLVWPSAMIWPSALVNAALFNTLHRNYGDDDSKLLSRTKFFLIATAGSFVWFWFPGYLFTALSVFNWVCWIAPNNVVVNQLFGYNTGLGMGFLTFDWTMISLINSPLVVPWWAQVNTAVAFVVFFWFLTPILYYTNVFYSKFLPMSSDTSFDNTGAPYDPSRVIQNGTFSVELYKEYSPLFMPITFALSYAVSFAALTAIVVHTFMWYRGDILRQSRLSIKERRDIHSRLMSVYPEVPHFWYGILGLVSFILAIVTVEVFDTQLPAWGLIFAIVIAFIFIIPSGMIQAIANQILALEVLGELIAGYLFPGRPTALMIFKTFSFITMNQAITFVGDMKLGHYMKIPPRLMFLGQVIATIVATFVSVIVQEWMFDNVADICTPDQPAFFTCNNFQVFGTAALIWGGIGPERLFSKGQLYYPLIFFFLLGGILPIIFYYLARRHPLSNWKYVNVPVMLSGLSALPPATGINFSAMFMVGAFFQFFLRRYHFRWWMRFNYILSAALDSGVSVGLVVIFFTVQFPKGGFQLNWWGNNVWQNTLDAQGVAFNVLQPGQTFGPATWS